MTGGTFKTSLKHLRQTSEASARFLYRKKRWEVAPGLEFHEREQESISSCKSWQG